MDRKLRAMQLMDQGSSLMPQESEFSVERSPANIPEPAPVKKSAISTDGKAGAAEAAKTAADGGNLAQTAGAGMMATGNPYLMAAGLGMNVIGGAQEREREREKQEIQNEIERRQRVVNLMGKLGQGFGRIG